MISNIDNIKIVVQLLKQNNIKKIVISPGGTNIPFVREVQDDPDFECFSVVDERSAVYFAIGLYLQCREPIVCSCTSAQATRNYIPGLTEAYYKRVPILAVTMAKHPRFTYQEYMQAPDQISLPNDCVKKSIALPFLSDINGKIESVRKVNEAINLLQDGRVGPVQLCIPWLDFPIDEYEVNVKAVKKYTAENTWNVSLTDKKILVVIGEHTPFDTKTIEALENFADHHNVAIYSNHLSNYSGAYTVRANLLLLVSDPQETLEYVPDIIVSIGGQTGDYPFYNYFSNPSLECEHWRVAQDGELIDTYDKLTKVFACSERFFFEKFTNNLQCEHSYFNTLNKALCQIHVNIELPFSNAWIAQFLHDKLPEKSSVQFSILNSLRVWNFYDLHPSIQCYSNVGAFGIDGGMSTLIGQSILQDNLCFMVIGDLAFYYDMNSIGIRHIKNNLRILLINNNGGIEFKYSKVNNQDVDRYIAAGNHFKNAQGWAITCGFKYISAVNKEQFCEAAKEFIRPSDQPILLEAFVSDLDEADAYDAIVEQNKPKTMKNLVKKALKGIIK